MRCVSIRWFDHHFIITFQQRNRNQKKDSSYKGMLRRGTRSVPFCNVWSTTEFPWWKQFPSLHMKAFAAPLHFSHWFWWACNILLGHCHFQAVINNTTSVHFLLEPITSFLNPGQNKAGPATPALYSSYGSHCCAGEGPGDLPPGRTTFDTRSTNWESFKVIYILWASVSLLVKTNNTPEKTARRANHERVQRHTWLLSSNHCLSSAHIRACTLQVFLNKDCLVLLLNPFTLQWSPSFCQDKNLGVVFESPSSYSLDSFISRSWDSVFPLSSHLPRHHSTWATFSVVPQTWLPNCCPHSQAILHVTNRDKNLIESSSTHLRGFLLPLGQNSILKQGSSLPVPAPYGTFPTLPLCSHPSRLQQAPSCLVNCYSSFRALLKCHHLGDGFPDLHPSSKLDLIRSSPTSIPIILSQHPVFPSYNHLSQFAIVYSFVSLFI